MGKTIRGEGTVDQWNTVNNLARASADAGIVLRSNDDGSANYTTLNKFARQDPKTLSKVLLLQAITCGRQRLVLGRQRNAMTNATEEQRYEAAIEWDHQFGLREGRSPRAFGVADFVMDLERWLRDSAHLRRLHQQSVSENVANPVTVFSRRRDAYEDSHVGLFVGSRGGMPNHYTSITYQSQWADADLSFLQNLLDRLKPLSTLLMQTHEAHSNDAEHQRNIELAKQYESKVEELQNRRDEMVREDKELHEWLMAKPAFIRDHTGTRVLRTHEHHIRSTKWSLLGRHSWEDTMRRTQQSLASYQNRIDNHTPHHMGLVNRDNLNEEIVKVMTDALRYAVSYSDVEVVE